MSWIVAHLRMFRLFMKGNFDAVTFDQKDQKLNIVAKSTVCIFYGLES